MKNRCFLPLIFAVTALLLLKGCKEENDPQAITGKLTNHSECKNFKSLMATGDTPDTLSCISFLYEASAKRMQLTHINAGFNCCPGKLWCDVSQACDCNCLFDLEMELSSIEIQEYVISFIEPYAGDQEPIIFTIDLASDTEGTHCVIRKEYPWGMN